jgi:DNA-binding NarL/FixJ family response regulator
MIPMTNGDHDEQHGRPAPGRPYRPIRRAASALSDRFSDLIEEPHAHPDLHLTPRQAEVLELLERGRSTSQIAEELQLSTETVRNHIRHLLRAVGAHSRLEAVAIAHRAH